MKKATTQHNTSQTNDGFTAATGQTVMCAIIIAADKFKDC
jgi:hypothetical protein